MITNTLAPVGPDYAAGVDLGGPVGLGLPGGADGPDAPGFDRPLWSVVFPGPVVVVPAPARPDEPDEEECWDEKPAAAGVLKAALSCAGVVVHGKKRLRLFPLKERSKEPAGRGWKEKATSDPKRLGRRIDAHPACNLGLATGGGLLVLDIDPRNGGDGSLAELFARHHEANLPTTAKALTGSGGRHYLFRVDPKFKVGNKTWRPGIDIKGDGGYVVVEPSVHPGTGKEYVWINHPAHTPIALLPSWLENLLLADGVLVPPSELERQWAREAKRARAQRRKAASPGGPDRRRDRAEGKAASRPTERPATVAPARVRPRVGTDDASKLTDGLIARYPITGFGQRRRTMFQVVTSVLGRGHDDDTTLAVVMAWWEHYADKTRASASEMETDVRKCVRSTRKKKGFREDGAGGHSARIAETRLSAAQEAAITPVAVFQTPRRPLGGRCPTDPATGSPHGLPRTRRLTVRSMGAL